MGARSTSMKAYLFTSGTIFGLFAVSHVLITFEHLRSSDGDVWFVLLPALIAILGTVLAMWAFRLTRATSA
jgi:hypothetical protein